MFLKKQVPSPSLKTVKGRPCVVQRTNTRMSHMVHRSDQTVRITIDRTPCTSRVIWIPLTVLRSLGSKRVLNLPFCEHIARRNVPATTNSSSNSSSVDDRAPTSNGFIVLRTCDHAANTCGRLVKHQSTAGNRL